METSESPDFGLSLTSLTFSDGTVIPTEPSGITVVIGPNNSGKSATLRDIYSLLGEGQETVVVKSLEVAKSGDSHALEAWIREHCQELPKQKDVFARTYAGEQRLDRLLARWESGPPFAQLGPVLAMFVQADGRLSAVQSVDAVNSLQQAPTHPLQHLQLDSVLEERLDALCRDVFGLGLALNRYSVPRLTLHVGSIDPPPEGRSWPPRDYLERFAALPLVEEQGDGMRSFLGVVLRLVTLEYPVLLIDEPEAFLHPPQARQLGRLLASERPNCAQVIVATHSSDVIQGLLEVDADCVTLVRLERDGDVNRARSLAPAAVAQLWDDPLLKYSNMLDGLFHQGVVICEGDADCRYYSSLLDRLPRSDLNGAEIHFTHTGGKHRMPTAVRALRGLSVRVAAIVDMDGLREKRPLRDLVESLGGDWAVVESDWMSVSAALSQPESGPSITAVREAVNDILRDAAGTLTRDVSDRVRDAVKLTSGWNRVKLGGVTVIPQGTPAVAARRLIEYLRTIGLHVVPVGELERWITMVSDHGPAWVREVHARGLHESVESDDALDFVKETVAMLLDGSTSGDLGTVPSTSQSE